MAAVELFADSALAERFARLDRAYWSSLAEAAIAAGVVERDPLLDNGSTIAFFAGDGNPLTQANGALRPEDIEAVAEFYRGRSASWEVNVTPFAHADALTKLIAIGGRPKGWESVLYRPYSLPVTEVSMPPELAIEEVFGSYVGLWSEVSNRGFFGDQPPEFAANLGRIVAADTRLRRYLAFWDGKPAAGAALSELEGVAVLGGMATLPEFRGRGIQSALLHRRLLDGRESADFATMGATAGSSSQRNAERQGFRLAWTQLSVRVPTVGAWFAELDRLGGEHFFEEGRDQPPMPSERS